MKILSYILVFVVGGVFGAAIVFSQNNFIKDDLSEDAVVDSYTLDKDVAVYMPWWDQDRSFDTIKTNKDKIKHIKAFWYEAEKDGSIKKYTGAEDEEIIKYAKANSIKLIPVINNDHSPERLTEIFSDDSVGSNHIDNIVSLVLSNDFDGIEIDYESKM